MSGDLVVIRIPKWGLSMQEGKVVAWLIQPGAEVSEGDEIVEIETDKVNNVIEAPSSGTMLRHIADEGTTLEIGRPIAIIGPADTSDDAIAAVLADMPEEDEAEVKAETAEPQLIEVGDHRINTLVLGQNENSVPVLMIHGFAGDLGTWMFNQSDLSADRPAVAIDLPGHGASSKAIDDGSVAALARIVTAAAKDLGFDTAHLVGHSLGGAIAIEIAVAGLMTVKSLVLAAPAGLGDTINDDFLQAVLTATRRKAARAALDYLVADSHLISREMVQDFVNFKRLDGVEEALRRIHDSNFASGKQQIVFSDAPSSLSVPALLVWGLADAVLPSTDADKLNGNSEAHLLEGVGHLPHMEKSNEFNRVAIEFIQSQE